MKIAIFFKNPRTKDCVSGTGTFAFRTGMVPRIVVCLLFLLTAVANAQPSAVGMLGEYFVSAEFRGSPAATRIDPAINFNWGTRSPAYGVPNNWFSVRWTGQVLAPVSGLYTFYVNADNGVRLWINGGKVIDHWTPHNLLKDSSAPIAMEAGKTYTIRLEYSVRSATSSIALSWSYPGRVESVIPQQLLYPPATTFVSDLTPTQSMSTTAGNGTIASTVYGKSLASRTTGDVRFNLNRQFNAFSASIGIDDETGMGQGVFEVWLDGAQVYQSPTLTGGGMARYININVSGRSELQLKFAGTQNSRGDWADARLARFTYVSDLQWMSATSAWGPVEKDRSNGEAAAGDGRTIVVGGQKFRKGLGVHAPSEIRYALNGQYAAFSSVIGVDDETQGSGAVIFQVFVDGVKAYESSKLRGLEPSQSIFIDTVAKNELRLVVTDGGDGMGWDHADWADAMLLPGTTAIVPVPTVTLQTLPAPSAITANPGDSLVTVTWSAVPGATSYSLYRSTQQGVSPDAPTIANITSTTYVNAGLANGTRYYFRVAAVNGAGFGAKSGEVTGLPAASTTTPPPATDLLSAYRLLRQASFGPTQATIERVRSIGTTAYVDEQLNAIPSSYPDVLLSAPSVEYVSEYFYRLALVGSDQLRQRVAWALSQIFVVSAVELGPPEGITAWIRILQDGAFGNFFDLMKNMTLSPAMGEYLDMVNNPKADPENGFTPNENYARELMQLFTLGLAELNLDGSQKLNPQGQPIPTYDQRTVQELTRAFTGWTYPDNRFGDPTEFNYSHRYIGQMKPVARYHDTGAKTIFGQTIPGNQTAAQDVDQALRIIFNHPNVGPFIAKQLVQRLVTSNPSARYVQDVATVFNNNGQGVRGDLRAVVRAVLTHSEAPLGQKMMEPALFVASIVRNLGATVADHPFMTDFSTEMGQNIFYSPSVFNYFSPGYRIPGTTVVAPEFQIYTTATALTRANFVARMISGQFGQDVVFNLTEYTSLAGNPDGLCDLISNRWLGGQMPAPMRTQIKAAMAAATSNRDKALNALYLAIVSAQYQVNH